MIYQYRELGSWLLSRAVYVEGHKRRDGRSSWLDNSAIAIKSSKGRRPWYESQVDMEFRITRILFGDNDSLIKTAEICGTNFEVRKRLVCAEHESQFWLSSQKDETV